MPVAKVILPIAIDKDFDYSLSEGSTPSKGCRVLVDFNNKKTVAIVVDVVDQSKFSRLKPLISCLDTHPVLTSGHFEFSRLLAKAYPYPASDFLFMMLPLYLRKPRNLDFSEGPREDNRKNFSARFTKAGNFKLRYGLWKDEVVNKLARGSVIICFPQMAYLEQAYELIKKDFPAAVVINSYLSEKEGFKAWQDSRQKTLILGTRMALFQFPQDLELIVVEDESSPYYFQEEKPFYNLVEAAFILARHKGISLTLSGDYPSLDTYRLISEKQIELIEEKEKPADIRIVDVLSYRNKGLISPLLAELLRKNIEANKKSLILWNKKGTASYVSCETCGWVLLCKSCLSFMHLDQSGRVFCPHCGVRHDLPPKCPNCNNGYLKGSGAGVEKIETVLKKYFPAAKISQWDKSGDSAQITVSTPKILSGIYGNENFDNAYLLDIDNLISRLDYGAAFEAFLYVKKIAGLVKASFYVFTRNMGFYLFECLNKDWREFYNRELEVRQKLNLPPFGLLATVTLRGKNEEKLFTKAEGLVKSLEQAGQEAFGPLKEYPLKLRGKFRYSIVVKYKYNDRRVFQDLIKKEVDKLRSSSLQAAIVIK